jgi:hypothetical protein
MKSDLSISPMADILAQKSRFKTPPGSITEKKFLAEYQSKFSFEHGRWATLPCFNPTQNGKTLNIH